MKVTAADHDFSNTFVTPFGILDVTADQVALSFTSSKVLFLSEDDDDLADPNDNYYVLTGMVQGKFSLKAVKGTKKEFFNKIATNSALDKDSFKLSTIREDISSILKDLEKNPIEKMTEEEIRIQNEKVFGK